MTSASSSSPKKGLSFFSYHRNLFGRRLWVGVVSIVLQLLFYTVATPLRIVYDRSQVADQLTTEIARATYRTKQAQMIFGQMCLSSIAMGLTLFLAVVIAHQGFAYVFSRLVAVYSIAVIAVLTTGREIYAILVTIFLLLFEFVAHAVLALLRSYYLVTYYPTGSGITSIGRMFITPAYNFMMGKSGILGAIDKLRRAAHTEEIYERNTVFLSRCHKILIRYIGCNILDAVIIGLINAVFMIVTGMPYVPLISLVVGVTNLLPTFGPIIGGVIGGFILVLIKPMYAIMFIAFTMILQTFDGYILKPKLFGESLGVSAVVILVTIILGGKIFGVIGILLAIPFAAIMTFLYDEAILPGLEKRKKQRAEMIREFLGEGEIPSRSGTEAQSQEGKTSGAAPTDPADAEQTPAES